jgi:dihydroneopterin aldolase
MKTIIELKNIKFYAYHGVLPHEAIIGNEFTVNIHIESDLLTACISDNVDDTINYADVYQLVKVEMDIASQLLENVAYRILRSIKNAFPQILFIEVRLAKLNPPIAGDIESAGIVISE